MLASETARIHLNEDETNLPIPTNTPSTGEELRSIARKLAEDALLHQTGQLRRSALKAAEALVHYVNLLQDGKD